VEEVEDVVKIGDVIPVKVVNIDEQGRLNLSAKEAGFNPPAPDASNRPRRDAGNSRSNDSRGARDSRGFHRAG